ncbi:hypothetical protein [Corynebacterium anserum]|uniref:Uncharacterized protein n=1 Tax=Corynebacterium anserum TaxID=2684406 RepID=A0A7G7YLV7_9CORY|nr:hypothetical protein [Corynebacterium anserum]QNH95477.1 hypothetical protein GP473_01070 [Corynebacterium anserum]
MTENRSTASIGLSPSLPKRLWGYGTDLSSYDLSLYLHGTPLIDSQLEERFQLADRRPWKSSFLPGNIGGTQVTQGIIITDIKPQGLYYREPVAGIYSLTHAGHFEVTANSLETLFTALKSHKRRQETLTVNSKETNISHFCDELLFWGDITSINVKRATFDKVSEQNNTVLIQRRFDEKLFRISKCLENAFQDDKYTNESQVEKLFS